MPHLVRIFPEHNLAYIRYSGKVTIDDYAAVVQEYTSHPQFSIEQKQLIDLRYMTDVERDYARIIALQAKIAEYAIGTAPEILSIAIAPTPIAMEAVRLVYQSWDDLDTPVARKVVRDVPEAADLLGIPLETLNALIATVEAPPDTA